MLETGDIHGASEAREARGTFYEQIDECCYVIETIKTSEAAYIFFAMQKVTNRRVVIKILREYKDTRYSLEKPGERQRCQLEALRWNQRVTEEVYCGMGYLRAIGIERHTAGPLSVADWSVLYIDGINKSVAQVERELIQDGEYALVMELLPGEARLDRLLLAYRNREVTRVDIQRSLSVLIQRIVQMHHESAIAEQAENEEEPWGSPQQLVTKLEHNIELFKLIANVNKELYCQYADMKFFMRQVVGSPEYRQLFQKRLQRQQIKRCHGDLKASNIWIELEQDGSANGRVSILDAIDFNGSYCNIDVLSDLAMLSVDIEANTGDASLSGWLLDMYLQKAAHYEGKGIQSGEDDETARAVYKYYLIEKAIVRAAVSIVYDGENKDILPDIGADFLKIAARYLDEYQQMGRLVPVMTRALAKVPEC